MIHILKNDRPNYDHIERRTELDRFREQQHVDDIPLEDLKIEQEQEKNQRKTQDSSQSERKYRGRE